MKLFGKVLLSFSIVITLFIALSIYSLFQANTLKSNGDQLHVNGVNPTLQLIEIGKTIENTRVHMLTAIAFQNKEAAANAEANLEIIPTIHTIFQEEKSAQLSTALSNFEKKFAAFEERIRQNISYVNAEHWEAGKKGVQNIKPYYEDLQAAFNEVLAAHSSDVETIIENNNSVFSSNRIVNIVLIILTTAFAIFIAYALSKHIVKRLQLVVDRAKQIANGDLTGTPLADKGKDEIVLVASNLDAMQNSLSTVVKEAATSSQQVSASAEELSATAQESMSAAEIVANLSQHAVQSSKTQMTSLTNISHDIATLDTSVQTIANNGLQMQTLSQQTFTKTQEGKQAVVGVNNQIELIAQTSKQTEHSVKSLNEKSHTISAIVDMITQIAEQTNLLALNAAIEAARAGDAGKGFAVVADEVRNLAEESRQSAEQIHQMVQEIQGDISSVIVSIQEEASSVEAGLAKSHEVRQVFGEIEAMVGDVTANAKDINQSIVIISSISENILVNTKQVEQLANQSLLDADESSKSTETQLSSMQEISAASESLAHLSEQLQVVIQHFKL